MFESLPSRVRAAVPKKALVQPPPQAVQSSGWKQLGLSDDLITTCRSLGLHTPTSVQNQCIPPALSGADVMGCAPTGSGKTAAFALPILQKLAAEPYGVFALVLTPTRELAHQIADQFNALGAHIGLRTLLVVGGLDMTEQSLQLAKFPHVVVATPGRLATILGRPRAASDGLDEATVVAASRKHARDGPLARRGCGKKTARVQAEAGQPCDGSKKPAKSPKKGANTGSDDEEAAQCGREDASAMTVEESDAIVRRAQEQAAAEDDVSAFALYFRNMQFLVLDEADSLLASGFATDIAFILRSLPTRRQTLLFSATLTQSLRSLEHLTGANPARFHEPAPVQLVETLDERYLLIPQHLRENYLALILKDHPKTSSVVVFVHTCRMAQLLTLMLRELEIPAVSLHSRLHQKLRLASLDQFKTGLVNVLICTDVAARGLDIPTVDLVLNFTMPNDPTTYVHRVGRTARAGKSGRSITFVTQYDVELVQQIEAHTGRKMVLLESAKESDMLADIKRVATAKQVADLQLVETGFDQRDARRRESNRAKAQQARGLGAPPPGTDACKNSRPAGASGSTRKAAGRSIRR